MKTAHAMLQHDLSILKQVHTHYLFHGSEHLTEQTIPYELFLRKSVYRVRMGIVLSITRKKKAKPGWDDPQTHFTPFLKCIIDD